MSLWMTPPEVYPSHAGEPPRTTEGASPLAPGSIQYLGGSRRPMAGGGSPCRPRIAHALAAIRASFLSAVGPGRLLTFGAVSGRRRLLHLDQARFWRLAWLPLC